MKSRPIHENLDTSFVNLSALVRYLRRRQFVGRVRVELSGYEADIHLLENDRVQVREHDRIAGRIAEGDEALERLLIRAREPGGTIHVYQTIAETVETAAATNEKADPIIETKSVVETKTIVAESKPETNGFAKPPLNGNGNHQKSSPAPESPSPPKQNVSLPNFPFDLTNEVEARARQAQQMSSEDWQTMMQLIAELLGTIETNLAVAKLNFSAAFTKVRAEIAADYPFLNPASGVFDYANGKMTMRAQVSAKLFVASINESLRRILERLGSSQKFSEVYRQTIQEILALIHRRKPLYQKFFITPQLEKIVGA